MRLLPVPFCWYFTVLSDDTVRRARVDVSTAHGRASSDGYTATGSIEVLRPQQQASLTLELL